VFKLVNQMRKDIAVHRSSAKFENIAKTRVLPAAVVALKKQPLAQIQAAYSIGALSKAGDARRGFLASL
jgi:hypothetical protein